METPEVHVHPHHTGHQWVDYVIAGTALLVSVISLSVAVGHGRTMEKLVAANSWPYVSGNLSIGNQGEAKGNMLLIRFANSGIGPAEVRSLEVFDGARALRGFDDLIRLTRAAFPGVQGRTGFAPINGTMLPRDGHVDLFTFASPAMSDASVLSAVPKLSGLRFRLCYCSVFDECYLRDDRARLARPERISACPVVAAPFDDHLSDSRLMAESPAQQTAPVEPAARHR